MVTRRDARCANGLDLTGRRIGPTDSHSDSDAMMVIRDDAVNNLTPKIMLGQFKTASCPGGVGVHVRNLWNHTEPSLGSNHRHRVHTDHRGK